MRHYPLQQPLQSIPLYSARSRGDHSAMHRALYVKFRGDNILRFPTWWNDVLCDGDIEW